MKLNGLFAIFAAITCFGTGNAVQTNAISGVLWGTFGVPTWITALILFLLIASVLLGLPASAAWREIVRAGAILPAPSRAVSGFF